MTKRTAMIGAPASVLQKPQAQLLSKDNLVLAAITIVSLALSVGLYKQVGLNLALSLTLGALGFFVLFSLHYIIVQLSASDSLAPRITSLERVVARLSRDFGQYEDISREMAHFKETCARIDSLQSQLELGGLGDMLHSRDEVAQRLSQEIGRLEAQIAKMKIEFDRVNKDSRGKLTTELEGIESFVKGMGERYMLDGAASMHQLNAPLQARAGQSQPQSQTHLNQSGSHQSSPHQLGLHQASSQANSSVSSGAQPSELMQPGANLFSQTMSSHAASSASGVLSSAFMTAPLGGGTIVPSSARSAGLPFSSQSQLHMQQQGAPVMQQNTGAPQTMNSAPQFVGNQFVSAPHNTQNTQNAFNVANTQNTVIPNVASLQNAFPLPSHLMSQPMAQSASMLQPGVSQANSMQTSHVQTANMPSAHMQSPPMMNAAMPSSQMALGPHQKRSAVKPNLPRSLMPRAEGLKAEGVRSEATRSETANIGIQREAFGDHVYGDFSFMPTSDKLFGDFDFSFDDKLPDTKAGSEKNQADLNTTFSKTGDVKVQNPMQDSRFSLPGFEQLQEDAFDGQMRDLIRSALEANRIDLYLQPVVSLPDRNVVYYEALTRLRGVAGELILPSGFTRIAEREGYMSLIDNVMIFRSSQVLRKLASRGSARGVFCNISHTSLLDPEFFPDFVTFMEQNKSLAENLFLDFNQSILQNGGPIEIESLNVLARLGYKFALDRVTDLDIDFAALQKQGFRYIKIDAETMLSGMERAKARIHAADMRHYLQRFGLELIVPGIETENVLARLSSFGINLGQGYLFSEPRPVRPEVFSEGNSSKAA